MIHTDGEPTACSRPLAPSYAVIRTAVPDILVAVIEWHHETVTVLSRHAADPDGLWHNVVVEIRSADPRGRIDTLTPDPGPLYTNRHDAEDAACAAMN